MSLRRTIAAAGFTTDLPLPQHSTPFGSASASFSIAACLVTLALAPAQAQAWCRASDEVGADGACVPKPTLPFLFWKRSCIAYQFNVDFFEQFERLQETEIRAGFDAAFEAWAAVECEGRGGFFAEQRSGTTTTAKSEYLTEGSNEMVVLALDSADWAALPDHSPRAVALTLMWHSRKTGEILDTDMELNLGAGSFADCVANSCEPGTIDLQNTITHEAGHVLGLGHSTDTSATMAAQTVGAVDTQKRSLTPDDTAGYCALDLPEWKCSNASCTCSDAKPAQTAPPLRNTAGCQVTTLGANASLTWLTTAALVCCMPWRRRRRA